MDPGVHRVHQFAVKDSATERAMGPFTKNPRDVVAVGSVGTRPTVGRRATIDDAAPLDDRRPAPVAGHVDTIREIDVRAANIRSIVWATGYSLDFSWVQLPVFDARGEPVQRRGVTAEAGIYFLGLKRQYKQKSSFLFGVGEDAAYLAECIAESRN